MRYLTSDTNAIADATLSATNVVASQAFESVRDATGGGNAALTGSYTGSDDAEFEIEILSNTINGAPQISAPVFAGVGNGTIGNISASSGIAAQEFTVTCLDLGTETRQAWAPFQSVNLRAISAGPGGNDLSVRVSQAGLTATATDYSVTVELAADGSEFAGEAFNFGATTLEPEGTVPSNAPRIRFGDDVTVYRHWKAYKNGRYSYHFSPAIRNTVPVGTRVYAITGGRTVTVYDGATLEETYSNITTLYSLLTAIQAGSTLIEVDGIIANDRRPGGMACDDLSVFTASYSDGSVRDGTQYIRRAYIPLDVDSGSPSETFRIECISAPIPGAEIWSVVGSVSGTLANAITNVLYDAGGYSFTIPQELQPGTEPEGDRSAYLELLTRGPSERIPSLCVRNFRLGSEAQTRTYTFEWRPRPGEECDCKGEPISGGPNDDFLGIVSTGGNVGTIAAEILSRVVTVEEWRKTGMNNNAGFETATNALLQEVTATSGTDLNANYYGFVTGFTEAVSAIFKYDDADMRAFDAVADAYIAALKDIQSQLDDLPTGVATKFDDEFTYIQGVMSPLIGLASGGAAGSNGWARRVRGSYEVLTQSGSAPDFDVAYAAAQEAATALAQSQEITTDLVPLMRMARASIRLIYAEAGLDSPFDVAGSTGNAVWQDHGGPAWFVSTDGLLPLQPGHYYHSAIMETDPDTGEEEPVATKHFGIGVAIGCQELLKVGDKLIITTSPYANGRATYQQGDSITYTIIRADPVALGGGQTGDDTLTFSVRGSVLGALADYSLVTTSPTSYSNGGLAFSVTPGGIDFEVGDQWTFSAEGGEFRWRKDGGSWSSDTDIATTVALSDGVSARFTTGETPSFVDGDLYTLTAYAINGAGQARTPDDGAMAWTSSQQLDITPAGSDPVACLLVAHHAIPSSATITLSASDDNFSTTPFSVNVPWNKGAIGYLLASPQTYAKWRLTIDSAGSIGWLYLGSGAQLKLPTGKVENGNWRQRIVPATATRSRTIAGDIDHSAVTQASFDELLSSLETALTDDDGRIGLISAAGDGAFVRIDGDTLPLSDARFFQSAAASRLLSLTIPVVPI